MSQGMDTSERLSGASEEELAAMLRWYVEMGVDLAVGDRPRDYFAEAEAKAAEPRAAPAPPPASGPRVAPRLAPEPLPVRAATGQGAVAPEEALAEARQLAGAAQDLAGLVAALAQFQGCALKRTASHTIFAEGEAGAPLVFLGDMPGADDDREGRMFAGRSGRMLERMLAAIGLDRSRVHLVNVVPWRPPGSRPPTPPELAICLAFVHRYLELARPHVIVTLGDLPTRHVIGAREPIVRARGKWSEAAGAPALAMLHPDYLLKAPAAKKHAWSDLRALRKALIERGLA